MTRARTTRRCLLATLVLASATGCAAIKATEQPGKKDFSILARGTPRTHVIAELGAPTWSEQRDGATTDVFAVRQGYSKGVKAGRALLHGAADVATIGLWEVVGIPVETLADGTDVRLSITYDAQQRVESVDVVKGEKVIRGRHSAKAKPARSRPVADPDDDYEETAALPGDLEIEPPE